MLHDNILCRTSIKVSHLLTSAMCAPFPLDFFFYYDRVKKKKVYECRPCLFVVHDCLNESFVQCLLCFHLCVLEYTCQKTHQAK